MSVEIHAPYILENVQLGKGTVVLEDQTLIHNIEVNSLIVVGPRSMPVSFFVFVHGQVNGKISDIED